jgi:hypothetical protein
MNTLWTFGDSMTFGHGCNNNCPSNTREDYQKFKKEGDDIWPNHLSKLLNYSVKNLGKNGASNDYIFDSILDNYDDIDKNDIVIINMTLFGRIDVPIGDNVHNVLSMYERADKILSSDAEKENNEIIESIVNFQYHFSNHQFYKDRHKKRFNYIRDRFKKDKKIKFFFMWSLEDDDNIYRSFQTIKDHTQGTINDTHFSFNGHFNFAHYLYSLSQSKKII